MTGTFKSPSKLHHMAPNTVGACLERGITVTQFHAEQNARHEGQAPLKPQERQPGGFAAFMARANGAKAQTPPVDEAKPVTGFASKLRLPGQRQPT